MANYMDDNRKELLEYKKQYGQRNKSKLNAARIELYQRDKNAKLRHLLRTRLGKAINNGSKKGSAVSLLGCTIEDLKNKLEAQFQPGMTWENWSLSGWHIDHIIPLASFDLSDIEQLKIACHYSNLQPLWCHDNLKKGSRI